MKFNDAATKWAAPSFPAALRGANLSPTITQGSQTSPPALGHSRNFPAPLQHSGIPDTPTPQTLGVSAPSQPQGSKPFPHSQRSQSLPTASSTQGSQPLPHLSSMQGYQPTSSLSASESQLLLTHPITQRVPVTPNPSEPRDPSPFPSPKGSSPPQHSGVPNLSHPLKRPSPSPLSLPPSPKGPRFLAANTQGYHHLPQCHHKGLTLTMASLVWAMSEMTPSVMMRRTKYWDPSSTVAAELGGLCVTPGGTGPHPGAQDSSYRATWLTTGAKLVGP